MKRKTKRNEILRGYIQNIIISLIFIIGIIFGIMLINNTKEDGKEDVETYINQFVTNIKQENSIDKIATIKSDIKKELVFGIIIWVAGSTIVGTPIVYGIIAYKGFCFGYTIAALIAVLGAKQGIIISLAGIFIQNIIFVPSIFIIAISGMKLYRSIVKNKKKENIKIFLYLEWVEF